MRKSRLLGAVCACVASILFSSGAVGTPFCENYPSGYTFTSSFNAEIAGLIPCNQHDQITVNGQLNINNVPLNVTLLNGYIPAFGDRFDILDWGFRNGTFGTIDSSAASLPAPLFWDFSQLYITGELIVDVQHFANGDLAPWDNPDGWINAADILIAEQLVLGLRIPGALQHAHGDMNTDGIIDAADLLLIQRTVLFCGDTTLGDPLAINFGIVGADTVVTQVLVDVDKAWLNGLPLNCPGYPGEVLLDMEINGFNAGPHFHGSQLVPVSATTVWDDTYSGHAEVIVDWTADSTNRAHGEDYTVCVQLVFPSGPVGNQHCTEFLAPHE